MTKKKQKEKIKTDSGFIALMSAVIVSVILLLIATNLSLISFYGRSNTLDFELKEKSSALAEACADTAILRLANNLNYIPLGGGGDTVNVDGNDYCTIKSVMSGGSSKVIKVQADYKNYITNLEIEVDSNMSIVSWKEM